MRIFQNSIRIVGGAVILSMTLAAQTFTTLYNFGSYHFDGINPNAGVIFGPLGEIYGTTSNGGEWGFGTVYELSPPAAPGGAWTEVVLHSFNNGQHVQSEGLLMGPNGSLYGVTPLSTGGYGTAFKLDPPIGGSTHWRETVLYQFPNLVGGEPTGAPTFGWGQSLYGATGSLDGAVYSLTPPSASGGAWTETTLYSFAGGSDGSSPVGALAVGRNGTLFGVTEYGGRLNRICNTGCGTVFSVTPPAVSGGPWAGRLLYAFNPQIGDGYCPQTGVILAPTGVLYGTTGTDCGGSSGTVFSLTPPAVPGGPMTETILHRFTVSDAEGYGPSALVLGPNGVLYGTTYLGGPSSAGAVFKLAPPASAGGSWTETILHSFLLTDGIKPNGLALSLNGTLYGTTTYGGTNTQGTVFALTP